MTTVAPALVQTAGHRSTARRSDPATARNDRRDSLIVYGDFTDVLSYLASRHLDRVHSTGITFEWRGVVAYPSLTVRRHPWPQDQRPSRLLHGPWRHVTPQEVQAVVEPVFAVGPQPPLSAYAEAVGAGVGDAIRQLLFEAYWSHGADIGDPEVLRRLLAAPILHGTSPSSPVDLHGYVVAPSGSPVTTDAWRRIRTWQQEWEALGRPSLPVVTDEDTITSGRDALELLAAIEPAASATAATDNPYPLPPLRGDKRRVHLHRPHGVTPWWET